MRSHVLKLSLSALAVAASGLALAPAALGAPLRPGTLLQFDFEDGGWPGHAAQAAGTSDTAGSTQPSSGLRATGAISSGPLAQSNSETNLGKLSLAFSLSSSSNRPVQVLVESFDGNRNRTGGLETWIYPAAPNFYGRYALDLSGFGASGSGTFQANAPFVGLSFAASGVEMRLDNVHLASPAFYVRPGGSNFNNGRSEDQAFATPQKALDVAQASDIIVLMEGTYQGGMNSVAAFKRPGTPAGWISLKNYPGHRPLLTSTGWNLVNISQGNNGNVSSAAALAYLEVRGLHVRGEGDVAATRYPEAMGKVDSRTNGNGISCDGRYATNKPHHIRIADNTVEFCPGLGIGAQEADWVAIENNIARGNSWTTIYATSGISVLSSFGFDGADNKYTRLVRNNICFRNETYVKWAQINAYSDGNGIILDINRNGDYKGRTLVQSNLSFDNGGSGIHAYKADRVDIINNTAYLNSASTQLEYGQIFANDAQDIRIANNILVAPVANIGSGEKPESVNGNFRSTAVYTNNQYFGGNIAPVMGAGDAIGDPQFETAARDGALANFHLKASSPALGSGALQPFGPFLDLDGKPRGTRPDKGVFQRDAGAQPLSVSLDEDTSATITLSSARPGPVTFAIVSSPTQGTLSGAMPNLVYTPRANFNGADFFSFRVTDDQGGVETGTVQISVRPVNDLPLALSTGATVAEDGSIGWATPGSDVEGPVAFAITRPASHGTARFDGTTLRYSPTPNYNGPDSFAFSVTDGQGAVATGTITLSVTGGNDAPTASPLSVEALEDLALALVLPASDLDGNALSLAIVSPPAHGTLSGVAPNLTYTPSANFNGADSFSFKAGDGALESAVATVSITVAAVPDAPLAVGDVFAARRNETLSVPAPGLLANDSDPDGDAISAVLDRNATNGLITLLSNGAFTYKPNPGFSGADTFAYHATDGRLSSAIVTVTLQVAPFNHAPIAQSQAVSTRWNTSKYLVLAATDIDRDVLSFRIVRAPAHGTLSGVAPNLLYTPKSTHAGADSFTFIARDASAGSNTATVSISAVYTALAPVVSNFSPASGAEGTLVTLNGANLLSPSGLPQVKFNGRAASRVTAISPTQIKAVVPVGATTGLISVTTAPGTRQSRTGQSRTAFKVSPKITSFSPTSGGVGTRVILRGTSFLNANSVKFNGKSAAFSVNSSTQITATVPLAATTGKISISTPSGTSASVLSFSLRAPVLTSFAPALGVVGSVVTLSGANLLGVTDVSFNGALVERKYLQLVSATQIKVRVPARASTGAIQISSATSRSKSAVAFKVLPRITSFTPASGRAGTVVVIRGSGFLSTNAVLFNGRGAAFGVLNAETITATVPAAATSGAISIRTSGGTAVSASPFSARA